MGGDGSPTAPHHSFFLRLPSGRFVGWDDEAHFDNEGHSQAALINSVANASERVTERVAEQVHVPKVRSAHIEDARVIRHEEYTADRDAGVAVEGARDWNRQVGSYGTFGAAERQEGARQLEPDWDKSRGQWGESRGGHIGGEGSNWGESRGGHFESEGSKWQEHSRGRHELEGEHGVWARHETSRHSFQGEGSKWSRHKGHRDGRRQVADTPLPRSA